MPPSPFKATGSSTAILIELSIPNAALTSTLSKKASTEVTGVIALKSE